MIIERSTGEWFSMTYYRVWPPCFRDDQYLDRRLLRMLKVRLTRIFMRPQLALSDRAPFTTNFPFLSGILHPIATFTASNRWKCNTKVAKTDDELRNTKVASTDEEFRDAFRQRVRNRLVLSQKHFRLI